MSIRTLHRSRAWLTRAIHIAYRGSHTAESLTTTGNPAEIVCRLVPRLSTAAGSLQALCAAVEPHFIDLGNDLQSLFGEASSLTRQTLETLKLVHSDNDQGVLAKVNDLVRRVQEEHRASSDEVMFHVKHVGQVVEKLRALHLASDEVEKIAMCLRVVGLNIKVESSRSAVSDEMFSVIAEEIGNLTDNVMSLSESVRNDSRTALAGQTEVSHAVAERMNELQQLAGNSGRAVEQAVEGIQQLISLFSDALEEANRYSAEISAQVGEIVMGIQFHDNMNQRIEHIVKALQDIEQLGAEGSSPSTTGPDAGAVSATVHSILTIQTAQLTQVISELQGVYQKNMQAFDQILGLVDNLSRTLLDLASPGAESSSENGGRDHDPFANLTRAMHSLHGFHEQVRTQIERMSSAAAQTTATTTRLHSYVGQVRRVSLDTHQKSLNAIIKAAHLGDQGNTLEVLAQEMTRLADRSHQFVVHVEGILEAIGALAGRLDARDPEPADRLLREDPEANLLDTGISDVTKVYEQLQEHAMIGRRRADHLSTAITGTRDALSFLPALAKDMGVQLDHLEQALQQLPSPTETSRQSATLGETAKLAERYTMQQERDIHEGMAALTGRSIEEPVAGGPDELPEDQVLLFEDEDGPAFHQSEPAPDSPGRAQTDATEAAPLPNTSSAQEETVDEDDLGDNVELF